MSPTKPSRMRPATSTRRGAGRGRDERGYVMVMSALVLVPLMVVAGFAVDLGGAYAQGSRMQRAADAAALAGVVWLPDFAKAQTVALDVSSKNGWPNGGSTTVTVTQIANRQLKVVISTPGNRYFTSKILGQTFNITRSAVAEYLRPIPMGSPIASLANDPESAAVPPQLWINTSGPGSNKTNGDRYTSGLCTATNSGFLSGCESTSSPSQTNDNLELSNDGYFFVTRVDAIGASPLHIQAYDPAFVYVGDRCTVNGWSAAQQTTLINQYTMAGDTFAAQRYAWPGLNYCSGDVRINSKSDVRTTFIVRKPDLTPLDLTDNQPICAISFDPYDGSTFSNNIFNKLDRTVPANLANSGTEAMPFYRHFRQWVDICTITSPQVGDYVVQVTNTADQSSPRFSTTGTLTPATGGAGTLVNRDMSIVTGGHNRMALRAGWGATPGTSGANLGMFAGGRLPLYVNQNSSSAEFYLARIEPEYAGATLALTFYDIADTAGTASMQVLPPPDSGLGTFADCAFTRDGSPPNAITQSGCGISGLTTSTYDGRVVTLKLKLPLGYTCNEADRLGCWLRVQLTFTGTPTDTTTWSASLLGDPVRLVE